MFDRENAWPLTADREANTRAYRSRGIVTQVATEAWQVAGYHELRRRVFVQEQGLFRATDEDGADRAALPIVAMSVAHGMPDEVIGTVRIFQSMQQLSAHTWYGGRLAVDPGYRRHGIVGESLIRAAVCTAHALGCREFLATVQEPVVRYFERHHFEVLRPTVVCGVTHALMQADLRAYPAMHFGLQSSILWADCVNNLVSRRWGVAA
jgi:putative N-acetyltransferase (TIGR04045 family)